MNIQNENFNARQSGQNMAGSIQQSCSDCMTSVSFVKNDLANRARVVATKFSNGEGAGVNWLEWLKENDNEQLLRLAYNSKGIAGVRETLCLGKTQAYELIARLGWRHEKIIKKRRVRALNYVRELYHKRLKHLWVHHKWTKGMNCCFLDSSTVIYRKDFKVGKKTILANKPFCVATLPAPSVRAFMKRYGLMYFVTQVAVVQVEDVPETARSLILLCSSRHLVKGPSELKVEVEPDMPSESPQ